jgi:hypothetical protein
LSPEKNDYNPITSRGTIEKASGILGRRRVRDSIPSVEHGTELILVDRNGEPRSGAALTTGERYWASEGTWLKIDVSDHELTYEYSHGATDGTAGYVIEVTVVVNVQDAVGAARRKADGVRKYILPTLKQRVTTSLPTALRAGSGGTLSTLNAGRDQLARALTEKLQPGSAFDVDGWLRVVVNDISVTFDPATASHYDRLVNAARTSEIDLTELRNKEKSAQAEIDLRTTWTRYLKPRMADPLQRAVEVIAADPSKENIQQVVAQLDGSDQWTRAEVVSILNKLIDKDFVADINELQAIKVIVDGLQRTPSTGQRQVGPGGTKLIEGSEVLAGSGNGSDTGSGSPGQSDDDHDWSD